MTRSSMGPAKAVEPVASNAKPKVKSAFVFTDKCSNRFKMLNRLNRTIKIVCTSFMEYATTFKLYRIERSRRLHR
ncbi:hypothetical protein EMIT0196MI5_350017 [Pseudomonas sp. IT-196MI5]